jgi:hypothetical protein
MGSGTTQSGNGASSFELFLFSTQPGLIREAVAAGVAGIIVDWESRGKQSRQENWDTEINGDTPHDLEVVRQATAARVICRLNGFGETTAAEIEAAVSRGVDEILLPMVRTTGEVKRVLQMARGRCGVGILVETVAATRIARDLGMLPLSRVYVGLNDLAIDRGLQSIFESVTDGAVERIREHFHIPFGFGGATLPDRGSPVPCPLLLGEMARMKCGFTFLRRSFHRDIRGRDLALEVPRIHQAIARAFARTPSMQSEDRDAIRRIVGSIAGESANAAGRIADTRA